MAHCLDNIFDGVVESGTSSGVHHLATANDKINPPVGSAGLNPLDVPPIYKTRIDETIDENDVDFYDSPESVAKEDLTKRKRNGSSEDLTHSPNPTKKKSTKPSLHSLQDPDAHPSTSGMSAFGDRSFLIPSRQQPSNHTMLNMNKTLQSMGTGKVILIKPVGECGRDLMNDPIEIANVIHESPFGTLDMDIRTNKKKGLIVAELKTPDATTINKLLTIEKLGSWEVKCYLPNSDLYKVGVISSISINADLDTLKTLIRSSDEAIRVHEVDRLRRKSEEGEWVKSTSLKITFIGDHLPTGVKIGYSFYRVRPFVGPAMQCFRCQRPGHTALGCNAPIRCMVCGEAHPKEACRSIKPKCANCSGEHKANSKLCKKIKVANEIEQVRAKEGVSYKEARNIVFQYSQEEHPSLPTRSETTAKADSHRACAARPKEIFRNDPEAFQQNSATSNSSYRDAVAPQRQMEPKIDNKSKQCDRCAHCSCGSQMDSIGPNFLVQLKNCFLEILQSNIFQENSGSRSLLVESAIRKSFPGPLQKTGVTNDSLAAPDESSVNRMDESVTLEESAEEGDVLSHDDSDTTEAPWKDVENKRQKPLLNDQHMQHIQTLSDDSKTKVVTTFGNQRGKGSARGSLGRGRPQRNNNKNKYVTKR